MATIHTFTKNDVVMEEEDTTVFAHLNKNDFKTMIQKEVSEYKSELAVFE